MKSVLRGFLKSATLVCICSLVTFAQSIGESRSARTAEAKADVEQYTAAIKKNPNDTRAHMDLAIAYAALGKEDKATAAALRAVKLEPDSADTHFTLGHVYEMRAAAEEFLQAACLRPHNYEAHTRLGFVCEKLKFYKEARDSFELAIVERSDYAMAHYGLGRIFVIENQQDRALSEHALLKDLDADMAERLFKFIYARPH
ncbi:MAG: tetratricopeptide repeat protein [Pyrinomonadaceae bacterium]